MIVRIYYFEQNDKNIFILQSKVLGDQEINIKTRIFSGIDVIFLKIPRLL
jgi:hypothetical protein